jgi:hypothetical protein
MKSVLAVLIVTAAAASAACGETSPSPENNRIAFQAPAPPPGATIQTGTTQFGGAFIERGSGKLSIPVTIEAGTDERIARLFIYAKDASGATCAQNLPDTPDLSPLKHGTVQSITVTGFQVYRLPCDVESFRAVLHRRESRNLNTELTAAEIITEAMLTARYSVR